MQGFENLIIKIQKLDLKKIKQTFYSQDRSKSQFSVLDMDPLTRPFRPH